MKLKFYIFIKNKIKFQYTGLTIRIEESLNLILPNFFLLLCNVVPNKKTPKK